MYREVCISIHIMMQFYNRVCLKFSSFGIISTFRNVFDCVISLVGYERLELLAMKEVLKLQPRKTEEDGRKKYR